MNYIFFIIVLIFNTATAQVTDSILPPLIPGIIVPGGFEPGSVSNPSLRPALPRIVVTPAEKDSIYTVAFNTPFVQEALKNGVPDKDVFSLPENTLYLFSILNRQDVDSDIKKELLISRIAYDAVHTDSLRRFFDATLLCGNCTDKKAYHDHILAMFIEGHKHANFKDCIYYINKKFNGVESLTIHNALNGKDYKKLIRFIKREKLLFAACTVEFKTFRKNGNLEWENSQLLIIVDN